MKNNLETATSEMDTIRAIAKLLETLPLADMEACGELNRAQMAIGKLEEKMAVVAARVPVFA